MGFSGTYVVIRHQTAPAELVGAAGFVPEADAETAACSSVDDPSDWAVEGDWSDGWRVWRFYGQLPEGYAQALTEATSAPVLTGQVLHSDAALVEGLGLRTGRWAAWLMVWGAVAYFDVPVTYDEDCVTDEEARELDRQAELAIVKRLLADAPGGESTARRAVAWAEEAGLVGSTDAVLTALDRHRTFAEDVFYDLLASLGIRAAEQPVPINQPAPDVAH